MPSKLRLKKIGTRIQRELSEMLLQEINDPRLEGIYITDVNVDRELAYASIYVSAIEGQDRSKEVLEGLNSASGFIRRVLSSKIELRSFPRLRFYWDTTPEHADQIEKLLSQIRDEE